MTEPLLTNDRARREWQWLVATVGEAAALDALAKLGNRKPYPLNAARILGLSIPASVTEAPRHTANVRAIWQEIQTNKGAAGEPASGR